MTFRENRDPQRSKIETERKSIDYLDPEIRISTSFTPEAGEYFPEVSVTDMESGRERYRILLGEVLSDEDGGYQVKVTAAMEADHENEQDRHMYSEGEYEVSTRLDIIKRQIDQVKKALPEYGDLEFVGDIHTHPVSTEDLDNDQEPWHPSVEDINDVIKEYESGNLESDKPFIFGIGSRHEDKTVYAFYRLVRDEEGYKAKRVEWSK